MFKSKDAKDEEGDDDADKDDKEDKDVVEGKKAEARRRRNSIHRCFATFTRGSSRS